jgi:hypothetical protein
MWGVITQGMVMHQSTETGGNQVRLQRVRRIRQGLAAWCLGCAVIMAGCSGSSEDTSASISQPVSSVAPSGIQNKSYRFPDGTVFHPALAGKPVTLTFGTFDQTVSAPFILVSPDGFMARGLATRVNFFTLNVQSSTFPAAQTSPQATPEQGPQVGTRIPVHFFSATPDVSLSAQPVDSTQQATGGIVQNRPLVCDNILSTNESPQAVGTLSSGRCLTVNGTISFDGNGFDRYLATVQQGQQEDLLVNFILTHPPLSTNSTDDTSADFDLRIVSVDSQQRRTFLANCTGTTSPEVCSVVLLSTDSISTLSIDVLSFFGTGDYLLEVRVVPIQINRAACGNPIAEMEDGIPPGTPPFVNDSFATAQRVGSLPTNGCLRINGTLSRIGTVPNDNPPPARVLASCTSDLPSLCPSDVDFYNFTTVGNTVLTFILTVANPDIVANPTIDFDLRIRDPNNANALLRRCERVPSPEACALTGLNPQTARNLLVSVIPFRPIPGGYTLDIISTQLPETQSLPPDTACIPSTSGGVNRTCQ